jgi:phosphatidylinositol alpha-1,6-mannosyltransferase
MKILYLSPGCFDMGGISRYNRYQIQALKEIVGKENVRALSLLGRDKGGFQEDFEVYWSAGGIQSSNKIRYALKAFNNALLWTPDVIFCAHVNLSGLSHALAKLCGARSVLNTYGLEVWSGLSKDASWGLKHSDFVISDCHFTANYLESQKIRSSGTTTVIWDCVNLEVFNPQKVNTSILKKYQIPNPENNFNILTLGRLSNTARHKGYERLIEVFKMVAKTEKNTQLIFAGKGDLVPKLRQLVKEADLEDRIHFTGRVEDEDLAAVYSSAHVFSLVSDRGKNRGEGIPLTPLEAMACGSPIIVGNHDGSQEAVVEGKNGFVIDPFDLEDHKKILINLIQKPKLLKEKALNTQTIAKEYFSYQQFKEKHDQFLKMIQK